MTAESSYLPEFDPVPIPGPPGSFLRSLEVIFVVFDASDHRF